MSYASEQGVLNGQWNAAEMAFQAEILRASPHVLMRPSVTPDGDQWCALYGENLQEGVSGFGDTPAAACADFDKNWREQRLPSRQNPAHALVAALEEIVADLEVATGPRGKIDSALAKARQAISQAEGGE